MSLYVQLLSAVFLFLWIAHAVDVVPEKCEDEKPTGVLKEVKVNTNCTGKCQLRINSTVDLEVTFVTANDTDRIAPMLSGLIGPIDFPFPGISEDVCHLVKTATGDSCPLKKGVVYRYKKGIFIKPEYPPIHLGIKWKFVDDSNSTIVCFVIRSQIIAD